MDNNVRPALGTKAETARLVPTGAVGAYSSPPGELAAAARGAMPELPELDALLAGLGVPQLSTGPVPPTPESIMSNKPLTVFAGDIQVGAGDSINSALAAAAGRPPTPPAAVVPAAPQYVPPPQTQVAEPSPYPQPQPQYPPPPQYLPPQPQYAPPQPQYVPSQPQYAPPPPQHQAAPPPVIAVHLHMREYGTMAVSFHQVGLSPEGLLLGICPQASNGIPVYRPSIGAKVTLSIASLKIQQCLYGVVAGPVNYCGYETWVLVPLPDEE